MFNYYHSNYSNIREKVVLFKLAQGIVETKNGKAIYNFAKCYNNQDNIAILKDGVIESKDAYYIYLFALLDRVGIYEIYIKELEKAIIATKNAFCIYEFARDVKGANIEKLENAVIKIGNPQIIYLFAMSVKGAYVGKLAHAIIALKDAKYIYLFARKIIELSIQSIGTSSQNIIDLTIAIIDTKNIEYITSFMYLPETKQIYLGTKTCFSLLSEFLDTQKKENNPIFSYIIDSGNIGKCVFYLNLSAEIRQEFINYLFNNIEEGNNSIILRIYSNMLKNPNIKEEDVDALDLEYKNYIMQNNKENNQGNVLKLKRFTDKKK